MRGHLTRRAHNIRDCILRWTGIPCRIGIAKKSMTFLVGCFKKAAENGVEFQLDEWRYILGIVAKETCRHIRYV